MKIEYKTLADIYNMNSSILLNISESIPEIHHEAYMNDIIVEVRTNEQLQCHAVSPMAKFSVNVIATHLLNVLIYGEEKAVTYKGNKETASLRSAAYRTASKLGIKISTKDIFGTLVISLERVDIKAITDRLDAIEIGQSTALPVSMHTTTERLRAVVLNYGERTGLKFSTRVIADMLYVTKSLPKGAFNPKKLTVDSFKVFVDAIPFDVRMKFDTDMNTNHMRVTALRQFGCHVTVHEDGSITKRSAKKGTEDGKSVVRLNGHIVYSGKTFNIPEINSILSIRGLTFEDL